MVEKNGKAKKAAKRKKIKLTVNRLGESFNVEVYDNEKIQSVINVMAKELNKPEGDLYFVADGKFLKNEEVLAGLKIKPGSPLYLAFKQDNPANRGPTGLLPPNDAGGHGKDLSEAGETMIDQVPNVVLTFLKSHEKITKILEAKPKFVKVIGYIPKILKHLIVHPDTRPSDLAEDYPETLDAQVYEGFMEIFEILATDPTFNFKSDHGLMYFLQLLNKSADIDGEKVIKFFENSFWKSLFSSPFAIELVVNFLPNERDLFEPEDRRKLLKSLVENPKQGVEDRANLVKESKLASTSDSAEGKRKSEENSNEKDGSSDTSEKSNTSPPEEKFKIELNLLEKMGFKDRQTNIKALEEADGNYDVAVGILIRDH